MEKTSREYAEKLAKEIWSNSKADFSYNSGLYYGIIEGYMKAIEETNAKGLLEALEFLIKSINPQDVNSNKRFAGVELGEFYVGGASIPSGEAIHKAIEAIKKASI